MSNTTITIHTEYIQLQQLLKLAGEALTGGDAKAAITSGSVSVNGEPCTQRGKKLRPGDQVSLNGHTISLASE